MGLGPTEKKLWKKLAEEPCFPQRTISRTLGEIPFTPSLVPVEECSAVQPLPHLHVFGVNAVVHFSQGILVTIRRFSRHINIYSTNPWTFLQDSV